MDSQFAFHPVSSKEEQTCKSLLEQDPSTSICLMPTHHISEFGNLTGFVFSCTSTCPARVLPISRTMFFGHTVVECQDPPAKIWDLITSQGQNKTRMLDFLQTTQDECLQPAMLDCTPFSSGYMNVFHNKDILTKDSTMWTPEVPDSIGIYHAMVRGLNREKREHKLYLVCSGGLSKACDEFCNLSIDVGSLCNAYKLAISNEAWWLRRACRRSRCRLLYQLAQAFGLTVPSIEDFQSHDLQYMAVHAHDSVDHDLVYEQSKQQVRVLNGCVNTHLVTAGAVVRMHPMEGYWLFRSSKLSSRGAFPTEQPVLPSASSFTSVVPAPHPDTVVGPSLERRHFLCFDESYLSVLQKMQWDRNQGITEMIPIVVGLKS